MELLIELLVAVVGMLDCRMGDETGRLDAVIDCAVFKGIVELASMRADVGVPDGAAATALDV